MIDASGKERLFLKNPADNQSGFWVTYVIDGTSHSMKSTEKDSIAIEKHEAESGILKIGLIHKPTWSNSPLARFDIEIWSMNAPIMLIRHTTTNLSNKIIEDMRIYNLMDFDVGGPSSYKDDVGIYDESSGIISAFDDNPLCASIGSKPEPNRWEIGRPTKLRIDNENRDLKNNLELGPRDITTALQWNHGNIQPEESNTVELVLVCSTDLDKAKALVNKSWELFKKKMR